MTTSDGSEQMQHSTDVLSSGAVVHRWTAGHPRAVVVLQHGFGEYAERYVPAYAGLVPALVEAGYEVHAPDLWGHGRSPGSRGVASMRLSVRDHLEVRGAAAGSDRPVMLVGHSLGGLVAALSALDDPAGLAGVVLLSPALSRPVPTAVRRGLGAVAAASPGRPIPQPRRPVSELSRIPSVGEDAAADPMMFDGQVTVLTAATALDQASRLWTSLNEWRHPTLVVHGTADTYTEPAASVDFIAGIASQDKTLHMVDGAFHELLNDECADEVLELLLAWLGAHASGPGPTDPDRGVA